VEDGILMPIGPAFRAMIVDNQASMPLRPGVGSARRRGSGLLCGRHAVVYSWLCCDGRRRGG
jgi:hypothetical protein